MIGLFGKLFYSFLYISIIFASLEADSTLSLTNQEREFIKNHPVITVSNESNYPPYNFVKNGKAQGYSIDYMNLLAKKIGIKVKYISGHTWSEFMQMAKSNELDVILNIRRTTNRSEWLHFTEPYAATSKAIFTNNPFLKNLKDLKRKHVCVPKKFYIDSFLSKHYPDIQLDRKATLLECIEAVSDGVDEATVGSYAIANYLVDEHKLHIKYEVVISDRRLAVGLSIATSPNMRILRDILQKAMYDIKDAELSHITARWLGEFNSQQALSNKSIIKPYKKVRIVKMCNNPDWAPIEFAENDNMNLMKGISIDTLKIIEEKINVKFENVPTRSWKESQEFLKNGKCDILPTAIETKERKKYANFTTPYLVFRLAVITKNDKGFVEDLSDISNKIIARKKGSGLINKLKLLYPHIEIIETKDYKESFRKVADSEAYCTIATLPVASYNMKKFAFNNLYVAGYLDMRYRLSIAVAKKDKELLEKLDGALSEITEYQYKQIKNRWINYNIVESNNLKYLWYVVGFFLFLFFMAAYRQRILKSANRELQQKVAEKVNENIIQHQFIQEQSKLAAMGEMIGAIAHQWRQPLNSLSLSIQNLEFDFNDGLVNKNYISNFVEKSNKTIVFMSETIDSFRNFYKIDKTKKSFSVRGAIESTYQMHSLFFDNHKILFAVEGKDFELYGSKSEFQQVVLNLISNSKDALLQKDDSNRKIEVIIEDDIIVFMDNGGGIDEDKIDKIFDSYYSTKKDGLGIGLYMSKIIIEDKFGGRIRAYSKGDGAVVVLDFSEREQNGK